MRSAAFLLLMFCSSVSRCQSEGPVPTLVGADVPAELTVLWDELRGLKDLVLSLRGEGVGQRQALRSVESRLRDRETMAEWQRQNLDELRRTVLSELSSGSRRREELEVRSHAQSIQLSELQSRMNSSGRSVEALKKKTSVLAAELPFLQTRLRASENTVEQLRRKNAVLAARLCNTESLMEDLRGQISEFQAFNSSFVMIPEGGALDKLKTNTEGSLVSVESKLEETRRQLEELKTHNTALLIRLRTSEEHLNEQNTKHSDVEVRLRSTETQLDQIQNHTAALEVRLRVSEEQLDEQRTETSVCQTKLSAVTQRQNLIQEQLDVLRTQSTAGAAELVSVSDQLAAAQRSAAVQLSSMESRLTDGLNRTTDVEVRLRSTKTQLDHLDTRVGVLEVRRGVIEEHLEDLRTGGSVCQTELSAVTERLNLTQEQLDVLRTQSSVGAAELVSVSDRLAAAQRSAEELQVRLGASEAAMMKMKTENGDGLKVGFSAGLTDSGLVGPFDEETTLIFSKTITNIGQGYNQSAGVFTAPVRGLYFFSFTAADYLKGYMGLHLYRNDQPVVFNLNLNDHGGYASTSNAVALQLDQGDQVHLGLPASYRLYDDSRNFSVFSGFLLFPL